MMKKIMILKLIKAVNANAICPPPSHSTQPPLCGTHPSAHTRHSAPWKPSLHCSSECVNVWLTQIDMLVVMLTGQHRSSACAGEKKREEENINIA